MKRKRSLSLIETFVAIFIFSIFFAIVTQIYRTNAMQYHRTEKHCTHVLQADYVQKLLVQLVMDSVKSGGQIYQEGDHFILTVLHRIDRDNNFSGTCEYRLFIDDESKQLILKTTGRNRSFVHEQLLLSDVDTLNMSFYDYKKDTNNKSILQQLFPTKTHRVMPYAIQINITGKNPYTFTLFPAKIVQKIFL